MNNVVWLNSFREVKNAENQEPAYKERISQMDKLELLNEMMAFQEERSRIGHLTQAMMVRGGILFKALEKNAETLELRELARSYARHLKFELEAHLKSSGSKKRTAEEI